MNGGPSMRRTPVFFATSLVTLAGCGMMSTVTEGFKQSAAVADDLNTALGAKPRVGFNWNNDTLTNVTIAFASPPAGKTLDEIAAAARAAVKQEFKQTPRKIQLAFDLDP